jgi:hypothetical protein
MSNTITRRTVVRKRVTSLRPSPENTTLYRPADDDPDIERLAESIRKNGLLEPLVVTADRYIVSGHRRHAALRRLNWKFVSCRVLNVRRDSLTTDAYVALLRDHNRQRNKTVAEQVREEVVDIDTKAAYQRLVASRATSVFTPEGNGVEVLEVEGTKTRCAISNQKADPVKYVKKVVFEDRRQYWPLSVRGVHYALLNYKFFRNIPRRLPELAAGLTPRWGTRRAALDRGRVGGGGPRGVGGVLLQLTLQVVDLLLERPNLGPQLRRLRPQR